MQFFLPRSSLLISEGSSSSTRYSLFCADGVKQLKNSVSSGFIILHVIQNNPHYLCFQSVLGGVRFHTILKFIVDLIPDDANVEQTEHDRQLVNIISRRLHRRKLFEGHGEKFGLYILVRSVSKDL